MNCLHHQTISSPRAAWSTFSVFPQLSRFFLNFLSFSSTSSVFPQLPQFFLNFLSFSPTFSVFPQFPQFFLNFLSFSSTFSVFPQLSQFFLNFLSFSTTFSVFPQFARKINTNILGPNFFEPKLTPAQKNLNRVYPAACASSELLRACLGGNGQ